MSCFDEMEDLGTVSKLIETVKSAPPQPLSVVERVKNFFQGISISESQGNLIDLGLRLCAVGISAYISARIIAAVLDPNSERKTQSQRKVAALLKRLGIKETTLQLSDHEIIMATELVDTSEIDKCWDDVGGQEELIMEIRDTLVLPMRLNTVKASNLLLPPKGVLLHGPPGCGKTLIAKALAKATGARFLNLQISTLTDKWYGESQKLTAALFSLARKLQPTIIFIDEIDAFMRTRNISDHECTAMMKAQFMSLWDGFASDPTAQVIIIGATNRPKDVDSAILRRMPARFQIQRPDKDQRQHILEVILRDEELDEGADLSIVAEASEGFSGSDLREVCRLAAINRAKEMVKDGQLEMDGDIRPFKLQELMDGVKKVHSQFWLR